MPDDLTIKLILDAVNNMSGKTDRAVQDLEKVTRAMEQAERRSQQTKLARSGSLFDPQTWSALMKDQETFRSRMDQIQQSGYDKLMVGGAMLAPVVATVKAAGDLEEVMNQIKIDTYDSSVSAEEWARRVAVLKATTVDLSTEVRGGATAIGEAVDSLIRGNVTVGDVANGAARAAVYLAQASKGEVSHAGAAEAVAKLGNAWQLTGKEIEDVADTLARVDAASTASIPDLIEGFKYVSSTASNLKIPVRDAAIALGVLNNAGIDASTAGTTLNQMLQHLQPKTKAAQEMFEELGLSVENNPFYDVNGRLKPMVELIGILRNATRDMTDQQKQAAFSRIFDERGSRAVINLLKEGKNSFEDIEDSLQRQMSLWDRVKLQNQGLNAQLELLKGNVTTLLSESGSPLGGELTGLVSNLNEATKSLTDWTRANPEATSAILEVTGAVGGLTLAFGALQIALGALGKAWLPLLTNPAFLAAAGVGATTVAVHKLGEAIGPYIEGTGSYTDRQIQLQSEAWDKAYANRSELAKIPTAITAPPKPWYERWFEKLAGNWSGPASFASPAQSPAVINIYARDAREAAQEVRQVLDRPTEVRYQHSRMPIPTE